MRLFLLCDSLSIYYNESVQNPNPGSIYNAHQPAPDGRGQNVEHGGVLLSRYKMRIKSISKKGDIFLKMKDQRLYKMFNDELKNRGTTFDKMPEDEMEIMFNELFEKYLEMIQNEKRDLSLFGLGK